MRKLRIPPLEAVAQTTSPLKNLMGFVRAPFSAADAALGRSRPSSSGDERQAASAEPSARNLNPRLVSPYG
jgi:hypothetical protein